MQHKATRMGRLAFEAFLCGVHCTNPFRANTLENRNWWYGWEIGAKVEEARFLRWMQEIPSKGDEKITENSGDCGC